MNFHNLMIITAIATIGFGTGFIITPKSLIELLATVAGRLYHPSDCLYPVAGDWVLVTDTVVFEVLA